MNKGYIYSILWVLVIAILLVSNLVFGSVHIPMIEVWGILFGQNDGMSDNDSLRYIVLDSRLPQALTAFFAGMGLSASGLLLQTTFRNPLAGPDVFGISSGASLAVALVMLAFGGNISLGNYSFSGFLALLVAGFFGSMVVIALISLFSVWVKNQVVLLIIGLMIGYLASSAISILNFFASAEGVKSYMVWGMGSFGNVTMQEIPWLIGVVLVGLLLALLLVKPLNILLLGNQYATNLGIRVKRVRLYLLLITGLLTAIVTAFCGPISFIGLITPHIARLIWDTDNHRVLLPVTMLMGGCLCLICNLLCTLPSENGVLPLNAITPLLGAPIIIYILVRNRRG